MQCSTVQCSVDLGVWSGLVVLGHAELVPGPPLGYNLGNHLALYLGRGGRDEAVQVQVQEQE